jgi:hypothetical protein
MRRNPSQAMPLVVAVCVLGAVLPLPPAAVGAPEAAVHREFTISSDPTQAVISVTSSGGLSNDSSRYVIYGDGRFVHESHTRSGTLLGSHELALPYDEVMDVVSTAVNAGLMDTDATELAGRMNSLMQRFPRRAHLIVTDVGHSVFVISLTSYSRSGEAAGAVTKTYKLTAANVLAETYPELPELAGLAQLTHRLMESRCGPRATKRRGAPDGAAANGLGASEPAVDASCPGRYIRRHACLV